MNHIDLQREAQDFILEDFGNLIHVTVSEAIGISKTMRFKRWKLKRKWRALIIDIQCQFRNLLHTLWREKK